jgi:hypothetical protein
MALSIMTLCLITQHNITIMVILLGCVIIHSGIMPRDIISLELQVQINKYQQNTHIITIPHNGSQHNDTMPNDST